MKKEKEYLAISTDEKNYFSEHYESYINGNISDFKAWLSYLSGDSIILFIKWLQAEGLKL